VKEIVDNIILMKMTPSETALVEMHGFVQDWIKNIIEYFGDQED